MHTLGQSVPRLTRPKGTRTGCAGHSGHVSGAFATPARGDSGPPRLWPSAVRPAATSAHLGPADRGFGRPRPARHGVHRSRRRSRWTAAPSAPAMRRPCGDHGRDGVGEGTAAARVDAPLDRSGGVGGVVGGLVGRLTGRVLRGLVRRLMCGVVLGIAAEGDVEGRAPLLALAARGRRAQAVDAPFGGGVHRSRRRSRSPRRARSWRCPGRRGRPRSRRCRGGAAT